MSELAREFFNKVADTYEEGFNDPYWKLYDQITANIIALHLPKEPSLVLDAGGGTGRWAAAMAQEGHRVMLLDISEQMLDVARERIKNNMLESKVLPIHGDIRGLRFGDNTFDFVLAEGNPISYCGEEHQKAIEELVRVAKHGTYILASVNNRNGLLLNILEKYEPKEAIDHIERLFQTGEAYTDLPVHAFTLDELKDCFQKAGAEIINSYGKHILTRFIPRDKRNQLEDNDVFIKFEKLERQMMSRPEMLGFAGHIMVVARKY